MRRYLLLAFQAVLGAAIVVLLVVSLSLRGRVNDLERDFEQRVQSSLATNGLDEAGVEIGLLRIDVDSLRECLRDLYAGSVIGHDIYEDAIVEDLAYDIRKCAG